MNTLDTALTLLISAALVTIAAFGISFLLTEVFKAMDGDE